MKNNVILTSEMIHSCKTERGGFTNAQIEYLGYNPKEKWIKHAIGSKLTQEEFQQFKSYANTKVNDLKKLKKNGLFKSLDPLV